MTPRKQRPGPLALTVIALSVAALSILAWAVAATALDRTQETEGEDDIVTEPLAVEAVPTTNAAQPPDAPRDHVIYMNASDAGPLNVTIRAGESVTWNNNDRAAHLMQGEDGSEIGDVRIEPRSAWTHTFQTPGTYRFRCMHEGTDSMLADMAEMEGVVHVEPAKP